MQASRKRSRLLDVLRFLGCACSPQKNEQMGISPKSEHLLLDPRIYWFVLSIKALALCTGKPHPPSPSRPKPRTTGTGFGKKSSWVGRVGRDVSYEAGVEQVGNSSDSDPGISLLGAEFFVFSVFKTAIPCIGWGRDPEWKEIPSSWNSGSSGNISFYSHIKARAWTQLGFTKV